MLTLGVSRHQDLLGEALISDNIPSDKIGHGSLISIHGVSVEYDICTIAYMFPLTS